MTEDNYGRRVKQRTIRQQQGGTASYIGGIAIGSAVGAVVGEYAKRRVFGE